MSAGMAAVVTVLCGFAAEAGTRKLRAVGIIAWDPFEEDTAVSVQVLQARRLLCGPHAVQFTTIGPALVCCSTLQAVHFRHSVMGGRHVCLLHQPFLHRLP